MSQIENNVSWGKTLGLHRDAHPKCSMLFDEHTALPVAGFSFDETLVRQHLHDGVPFLYLQFPVKDFGNSKNNQVHARSRARIVSGVCSGASAVGSGAGGLRFVLLYHHCLKQSLKKRNGNFLKHIWGVHQEKKMPFMLAWGFVSLVTTSTVGWKSFS